MRLMRAERLSHASRPPNLSFARNQCIHARQAYTQSLLPPPCVWDLRIRTFVHPLAGGGKLASPKRGTEDCGDGRTDGSSNGGAATRSSCTSMQAERVRRTCSSSVVRASCVWQSRRGSSAVGRNADGVNIWLQTAVIIIPCTACCKVYGLPSPRTGGGRAYPGHHRDSRTRGRGRGRDARGVAHPGPRTRP